MIFRNWVLQNFPFLENDFDALTDYELFCKMMEYVMQFAKNEEEFRAELDGYKNYFENLDVQEEIDNKLNEMAADGSLTALIKNYVDPIYEAYETEINQAIRNQNDTISNFTNTTSETITSINNKVDYFDEKLDAATNGAPLAASSTSDMTDTTKIYVNTTDGYWYYYDGEDWVQGGLYQTASNTSDVEYLLNRDDSSNEVDYDILSNILNLSQYTSICKNSLIHLINNSNEGIMATVNGLNQIKLVGTATSGDNVKISNTIKIKANTDYTLAVLDYTGSGTLYTYLYEDGTDNGYKDSTNNVVRVELNNNTSNNIKQFTAGSSDKDVQIGVYSGNGITRNNTYYIFLVEGSYTLSDIKTASNLSQTLKEHKFGGIVSSSTVIPTPTTPIFYIGLGSYSPFTNFNNNTVYYDADYLIIYNNINALDTWTFTRLPIVTTTGLDRQSLVHVTPESNISLTTGKIIWAIADTAGTYTNFKDYNNDSIVISDGEVAILESSYDLNHTPTRFWIKDSLTNISTKDEIPSNIETYVNTWLLAHPEVTTTVEDGSITIDKLDTNLSNKMNRLTLDSNLSSTFTDNSHDLNTIVGDNNMTNGIGSRNTIIGIDNLFNATSEHSPNREVAIGYHSLFRDFNGSHNVGVGNETMDNLSHGSYNTSIGSNALRIQRYQAYPSDTSEGETINRNVAIGGDSMYFTYGDNNTAIGYSTLKGTTYGSTGANNVAIGAYAGKYNTNESNHLYIDDRDRTNRTNEVNKSLIYGTFADDPADQEIKINGKFGCNGATPQAAVLAESNASDLASAITLLNQIKQVLIANGIMK